MASADYTATSRNCTKCEIHKPLEEFHRSKKGLYGHASVCKTCSHKAYKVKFAKHGAEINAKTLADYHKRQEPKKQAKREETRKRIDCPEKQCAKCGEVKLKSHFGKDKGRIDGLRAYCRSCHSSDTRKWRQDNPELAREAVARWRKANPQREAEKVRKYYHRNAEKLRARNQQWRDDNPEKARAAATESARNRRKRIDVRVHDSVGNRLRGSLRSGKDYIATFDILGYTLDTLMAHLEHQFLKGMSWDNYGSWHIDHITPLASFDISGMDDPELKRAWCLTNLRPIWAGENLRKSCKITHLI